MKKGSISPRLINDVIKYKNKIDVTEMESFLSHDNPLIRKAALEIIIKHGNKIKLFDFIKSEKNKINILFALKLYVDNAEFLKDKGEELVFLLESNDIVIKEKTIISLRESGRADLLLSLAFSEDEELVQRIKNYIEKQDNEKYNIEKREN